jgi:SRSO17 transposase
VDRSYNSYMETKKEFNIENDDDEEMLGLTYPIALREKKHYESIRTRYAKEKEEYEQSRAVLAKEREESHQALERSHKERLEWQESREKAKREREDIEVRWSPLLAV